ncbi:MAG: hypothetical protein AAGA17_00790 [Actinomycetota bacterium]
MSAPLPADQRPFDHTPVDTSDLPETPTRDRNIAASAWSDAPEVLLSLGDDLGHPEAAYKRRIHGWLLWRAGPARGAHARYLAIDPQDPSTTHRFDLHPDGRGTGTGPSGSTHERFRTWKEDLRDHPPTTSTT